MFRKLTLNIKNRRINQECQIEGIWFPLVIFLYLGKRKFGICSERGSVLRQREEVIFGKPDNTLSGFTIYHSFEKGIYRRQIEWVPTFNWQCWHFIRIWCPPWIIGRDQLGQYLERIWPYCDVGVK